ncbi:hypothetical protein CDAR_89961 [Caerostris darwini]|uniref:Uncharacterized protein n=1 Tax=Caerostris darwini TaxID=1538125 RepID=A0AAV4RGG4_9ARAC|nr:hypothetical protein CDAR_89961 [Caerostris darwini]
MSKIRHKLQDAPLHINCNDRKFVISLRERKICDILEHWRLLNPLLDGYVSNGKHYGVPSAARLQQDAIGDFFSFFFISVPPVFSNLPFVCAMRKHTVNA